MAGPGISISWQGNRAACQSTAWLTSDAKGHLWALLPLALSLGTGESPVLVALEAFTISSAAMLSESRGGSDWDSQTLGQRPLDSLPFFLCARTRHWHDFGPWKHTITFIACGLGGFRHFVPWQDVQNEFWTEQLLLGTEERRYVHAHMPLYSQAPALPSYYTIPFFVSAQMGHNLPTRHCENNLCSVPQWGDQIPYQRQAQQWSLAR